MPWTRRLSGVKGLPLRPRLMLASLTALGTPGHVVVLSAAGGDANEPITLLNSGYFMHISNLLIGAFRVALHENYTVSHPHEL